MLKRVFSSPLFVVNARYGAVAGLLAAGSALSLYFMGKHPFLVNPYFDFRIAVYALLLFFSLKEIRDYYQEGRLLFAPAMGGSLIFLAAATALSICVIFLFNLIQPDFLASYVRQLGEQIRTLSPDSVNELGKETVEGGMKELHYITPAYMAGVYAWQSVQLGFFISVIICVILRRQPKTP